VHAFSAHGSPTFFTVGIQRARAATGGHAADDDPVEVDQAEMVRDWRATTHIRTVGHADVGWRQKRQPVDGVEVDLVEGLGGVPVTEAAQLGTG